MKIEYLSNPRKKSAHCRVCDTTSVRCIIKLTNESSDHVNQGGLDRELFIAKCDECHSLTFLGNPVIGYTSNNFISDFWIEYAQRGAGISAMLSPLFSLGERCRGRLLDIGCGFGYVVDFWNKMKFGEAVGLEVADYGKVGKRLLDVPIHEKYYEEYKNTDPNGFDIVYSSEVIEHVPNPEEFVKEISKALSSNGILVLTTPSASAIDSNYPAEVIGALSPYFHYFIASSKGLEAILKKCGFQYTYVYNSGTRLFAWASNAPLPEISIEKVDWDQYFNYLDFLSKNDNIHVRCGALYRLFKDSWNTGNFDWAHKSFSLLEQETLKHYSLSFRNPDVGRYQKRINYHLSMHTEPTWFGCALLFAGMYVGHVENNRSLKVRMIDSATRILENEASNPSFSQFAQEPQHFYPYAQKQLLIAYTEALHQSISEVDDIKSGEWDQLRKCITVVANAAGILTTKSSKSILWRIINIL